MRIDFAKLTAADGMKGDSVEDTKLLRGMLHEAHNFLLSFAWCKEIVGSYFGLGIGGIVAVFLFKIEPAEQKVDRWLWVVVGDLPPAYLVTDNSPNAKSALKAYVAEMEEWIQAVRSGKSTVSKIPLNVPPTVENAARLDKRLGFLRAHILKRE